MRWRTSTAAMAMLAACSGGGSGNNNTTGPVTVTPVTTTVAVSLSSNALTTGGSATATATALDQNGAALGGRAVAWSSAASTIATVSAAGVVRAVGAGTTSIVATIDGKTGQAALTVSAPVAVATVTLTPNVAAATVGGTVSVVAATLDATGASLINRTIIWTSSDATVATVAPSATGYAATITAAATGTATITATSESKSATTTITVTSFAAGCTSATALQLAVGEVRALTSAQKAGLCLGQPAASEYVLIPFNNSTVAASSSAISVSSTGTFATTVTPLASFTRNFSIAPTGMTERLYAENATFEASFRERERRELTPLIAAAQRTARSNVRGFVSAGAPLHLTSIAATPAVGSMISLNANLQAASCAAKVLRRGRIVAVGVKSIIIVVDSLAPAGGYTDVEMTNFGTTFDTLVFPLDTLNFGAPTDIDSNGRVAIFFTPEVNKLTIGAGYVGGLQNSRDLYPLAQCAGSNEGEMFYMPVPDLTSSNPGYNNKTKLGSTVIATLMHEFQHLINGGRRIYVNNASNNASALEEVWLNEGLSHIAEELIYLHVSGQSTRTNIGLAALRASQAQLDAYNTYQSQNFGRLKTYLVATEANSPYSLFDGLEMRGAIWELLRYSADRKAGNDRTLWYNLVNTSIAGQANFNAVMGDITTLTRDWAVAQFLDDGATGNGQSIYLYPSWNFRSIFPALGTNGSWPLVTRPLVSPATLNVTLVGGGASYLRFRVAAGTPATIAATSAGLPLPANVDFILVRTQ
jgi:hypothetical protein